MPIKIVRESDKFGDYTQHWGVSRTKFYFGELEYHSLVISIGSRDIIIGYREVLNICVIDARIHLWLGPDKMMSCLELDKQLYGEASGSIFENEITCKDCLKAIKRGEVKPKYKTGAK